METNNWKIMKVETSHFFKVEGDHIIPLKLITIEKVSELTAEVKLFYRIICRQNPLPVKGEFESSFKVLANWLQDNGWRMTIGREVIYHHYHR